MMRGWCGSETSAPVGRGRPATLWSLAPPASRYFPDSHAELTVGLIDAARKAVGEDGLLRIIEVRGREVGERYRAQIPASWSLKRRVEALAKLRSDEGYMAEMIEEKRGVYLLIEHHCPVCEAAASCTGICASELEVFRQVLGAQVERVDHVLSGGERLCVSDYRAIGVGAGAYERRFGRSVRWHSVGRFGADRLELPEAMVDVALDVDGEQAVPRDFHRRMGDDGAGADRRGEGGFDIVDQPVRSDDGLLGVVHGCANADHPAAFELGRAGIAEGRVWFAELRSVCLGVGGAHRLDVLGHDFEVLDLHDSTTSLLKTIFAFDFWMPGLYSLNVRLTWARWVQDSPGRVRDSKWVMNSPSVMECSRAHLVDDWEIVWMWGWGDQGR